MKLRLTLILLFLASLGYAADERVTLRITITNLPVTGNNLVFTAPSAKTLIWSNTTTALFVSTNTTVNLCTTNLFLQMAAYAPWNPRPALLWANTNAFDVLAEVNQAIAVTASGTWATLTLSTQTVTRLTTVRVPIASEVGDTNRTNVASLLVKGITDHSTNAFGSNSIALAHALQLNTNAQRALGRKRFDQLDTSTNITTIYGGTNDGVRIINATLINGVMGSTTNGYNTNGIFDGLTTSNLVNQGNAIRSPGPSGTSNDQFGTGAVATNDFAFAAGTFAIVLAEGGTAVGNNAQAHRYASAMGGTALATASNSTAIGASSQASALRASAFGYGASSDQQDSTAIGALSQPTTTNQVRLGTASDSISGPGRANFGSLTNNLFTGTNMNRGEWADSTVTVTSLANGNNVAVAGSNAVVRLAAGPTAAFAICGITGGYDGRRVEFWNDTGQAMTIANQSGVDPTAANRIITTTGADLVLGTNAWVSFRYFGDRARWVTRRTD